MPKQQTQTYEWIAKWGHFLHSYSYYIEEQQERARQEHAPANAVFRDYDTGKWYTTDDVLSPLVRGALGLPSLSTEEEAS